MKYKKIIFFSLVFIFICTSVSTDLPYKLISNLTRKTVTTTLSVKFACSTTGSESTLTVKATSIENTSGIDNWYCHNYNTGNWVACPSSFNCSTYSLIGWNGYDKIRVYDVAGHVSNDYSLYKNDYENTSGRRDNDSTFSDYVGTNPIHILSSRDDAGTISSANIVNGRIKLTGKPDVKTEQKSTETSSPAMSIKICPAGTPVYRNGNYYCEASSYRLQNDTCVCAYKKNSSGKYEFDTASGWRPLFFCERTVTYCSDDYDQVSSIDDKYNVITRREPNNQNASSSSVSNSNLYTRPGDSTCFTYYKTDGYGNTYYSTFPSYWYESFYVYQTYINKYHDDPSYPPLPANSGMKKRMVDASRNTSTICNASATGTTVGSDYYSSHDGVTYANAEGICNYLMDKLNAGATDIHGTTTSSNGLMVPIIGSATCKFNGAIANTVSYSQKEVDINNNLLYYCTSGQIRKTGSGYECVNTTYYTEEYYYYDWYVSYFRK